MEPPVVHLSPARKGRTAGARSFAIAFSLLSAAAAGMVFYIYGAADGITTVDLVRTGLICLSTWWLAWGAATAMLGLMTGQSLVIEHPCGAVQGRTVVIVPVYNEDPATTFARIAAMDDSVRAISHGAQIDFAILSDTRDEEIAAAERHWCARLIGRQGGAERIFYRRRLQNTGRKAGNIEEFVSTSGRAWDYAVILDADSLMEGETILTMIRRMESDPTLGLLQTLPRVIRARSIFGRAMQFSASFHAPIFAHGLAAIQGRIGPFWGHNAIVRVRAWAESCGLPELPGRPPFGGHILSHDYVEAALLSRAGWTVRLDDDLDGSFEEGPENIIDHAKRDRRWCQGNLQHGKVIGAPRLKSWSRFVFFQGIFAYIAPLIWLGFIAASVIATATASVPNYFPQENWPFPVFPYDQTAKAIGLALGIFGLLVMPKLLVVLDATLRGRAKLFGGPGASLRAMVAELFLSSLIAPVLLAFQSRSVLQVLMGRDGGWPANNRGDGGLDFSDAWAAGRWISGWGFVGLVTSHSFAPALTLWLLPVALPMLLAPLLIWWSSRPAATGRFPVPEDRLQPEIVARHDAVLAEWHKSTAEAQVA